ncbi:unnamed protein product, partial [Allacma fusca]
TLLGLDLPLYCVCAGAGLFKEAVVFAVLVFDVALEGVITATVAGAPFPLKDTRSS